MDNKKIPEQESNRHAKDTSNHKALSNYSISEINKELKERTAEERILWACREFGTSFALTTSFGLQSAVLLNMLSELKLEKTAKIIWVDTGYLPPETYIYAEEMQKTLNLDITIAQSEISPARMEAIYGKLWETNSVSDIDKYHQIRKVIPLENAFSKSEIVCWASGVRSNQTKNRNNMNYLDKIRGRLSLRPILDWSNKDTYYYIENNQLPQHPLFAKGYSTVGDWHSSGPDSEKGIGRSTRFGGLKEECGIHLSEKNE